jgi:hypothetical protein
VKEIAMNNVMAMTALAAGLMVSTAAIAAPANLSDALQPANGLTLVKGGGGGGGGGFSGGGGHMGGGGAGFTGGHVGGGGVGGLGGGHIASGGGRIGGDGGPHFSGGDHIGGVGGPRGGMRYGANDHVDNGRGHFDHDHFDHDRGRHARFFPGDAFFYGGDYADYGYYGGDCGWLARQARATGSAYWWQRYNECVY